MKNQLLNKDLYSDANLLLHSDDSLLSNNRIFVGNQTDDFAVASFLTNAKRVLMLGLGYGGALRALLIGNKDVHITAVDINSMTVSATASIMDNYFPEVANNVNFVQSDAFNFLKEYNGPPFDSICIDIYTSNGYPPVVLENEFWIALKKVLSEEGTVLFNSWGLPQQLSPLKGDTVQRSVAKVLCEHFLYLSALPNRRNMTFIAHRHHTPEIQQNINKEDLNETDRLIVEFFPHRIKYADKVNYEDLATINNGVILTMDELNDEMYRRWPLLINKFNQALSELGLEQISDLMELLDDPIRARKVTKLFLEMKEIESVTIPVLVGASAFDKSEGLEWYLNWMLEDAEELIVSHKEWLINTALWQLLEVTANPYANYGKWTEKIEQLFNKLGLN